MTAPAGLASSASVFAALGDPTRLALLTRLSQDGPRSITVLAGEVPVTRQAVTKHLQILADAGLVHDLRSGRERIWEVETQRLEEARGYLEQISLSWDAALGRLKRFVEE